MTAKRWTAARKDALNLLVPLSRVAPATRQRRWKRLRYEAQLLLRAGDWDEALHPRDEQGRFAGGGGGGGGSGGGGAQVAFVSPNVSTNLKFPQAMAALRGTRQARLMEAGQKIDAGLGVRSVQTRAIGAWADGADNSFVVVAPAATARQMRVSAAMKGYLGDQKSVLVFAPENKGKSLLLNFEVNGNLPEIHEQLLKDGVENHTLEPLGGDRIRAHVWVADQSALDATEKAARHYGTEVDFTRGEGDFVGTRLDDKTASDREQRDDARRAYEQEIAAAAEDSGALAGQDIGKLWQDVRDNWLAGQAEEQVATAAEAAAAHRKTEAATPAPPKPPPKMTEPQIQAAIDKVAPARNFDPSKIYISEDDEDATYTIMGQRRWVEGISDHRSPTPIKLYKDHVDPKTAEGTIAHEIEHVKFGTVIDRYAAEAFKMIDDPTKDESATFKEIDSALFKYNQGDFAKADGVSDYSYLHWIEFMKGNKETPFMTAVHETLAEMARIEYETGELPKHYGGSSSPEATEIWRTLYSTVEKIYAELKGTKK